MLFNCAVNGVMVLSPPEKVAAQNGTVIVFENVAEAIAAAIAGSILVAYTDPVTLLPLGQAYVVMAAVGIGFGAVGVLVLTRMPRVFIPGTPAAEAAGAK
jgi:hypothetical protein